LTERAPNKEMHPEATIKKEAKKVCFVIAPIDKQGSETRKRSDQLFKHVISVVVEPLGYRPVRADHISEPGIITSQIIQHVVESPIVIADLTGRNPNVFYELAIRHAIRKPLVQLISSGETIPFDVAGTRTISIDINDLDSVELSKKELAKQIEAIEKGKITIDSPISVALDLKILKGSDNPEQRSLADVIGAISSLHNSIVEIEKRLRNPETLVPPDYMAHCLRRANEEDSMRRSELMNIRSKMLHELRSLTEKQNDEKIAQKDKELLAERLHELIRRLEMIDRDIAHGFR
jgi:hypothetical protein